MLSQERRLTQRAPDWWESARFQADCAASSWFRQNGVISSRPPAGNASRWATRPTGDTMPPIHFGFTMPADQLDKTRRATFVDDLNRALMLVHGHFDSAWFIDHLQFGDTDQLEGFTALSYIAALHPQLKFGHTVL